MKTRILVPVVAVTSFVLGAIVACGWWWHAYTHWLIVPKEVELAGRTGPLAVALAHLRLNETTNAIHELETQMDGVVTALAQWEETAPASEKIRQARDQRLVSVKIYHQSYPATGDTAGRINAFLSRVPGRSPKSTCRAAICRLDDLHHAGPGANTNTIATEAEPAAANGTSPRR